MAAASGETSEWNQSAVPGVKPLEASYKGWGRGGASEFGVLVT